VTEGDARRGFGTLAVAPVAAIGWALVRLLGLGVRLALFRVQRTQGATSVLWGLGFALFLWSGARALALPNGRAVPFALVGGSAIALFVYFRGVALENPPVAQPGAFLGRRRARRRRTRAARAGTPRRTLQRRELDRARIALATGDRATALFMLREASRVAVAQRRLDELLEVRELAGALSARSDVRTRDACERLVHEIGERLGEFPSDELESAGIRIESGRDRIRALLARRTQWAEEGGRAAPATRELSRARAALDEGDLATALFMLREAQRVAIAQRRLDELLHAYELAEILSGRSDGRTRAASEALRRKAEASVSALSPPG
jgi:hypothetical protein